MIKNSMYYMAILSSLPIVTVIVSPLCCSMAGKVKDLLKSKEKKKIEQIQLNFCRVVRELKLVNSVGEYPKDLEIKFIDYGFELSFNIAGICSYKTIESNVDFITNTFGAVAILTENNKSVVKIKVLTENLEQQDYKNLILSGHELLLGYNYDGEIIVNMRSTAHLLLSGLSNNGKTGLLRVMIKNLQYNNNTDIILCNAFKDDFRDFKDIRHITTEEEIKVFLSTILDNPYRRERPLYIILEELMTLRDKKLLDIIKQLLATARHYNIYIIGVIQVATKENCVFKDLFNARVSFKQIDNSSYRVALGVSVDKELAQREFYVFADKGLVKGKTYNLEF